MKRRVTFIHEKADAIDPKAYNTSGNSIRIQGLKAAREDRWTVGLYELPQEVWSALKQCHELHIRWVAPEPLKLVAPFLSTLSPGLHVYFTPLKTARSIGLSESLCSVLVKTFGSGLECGHFKDAFTTPVIHSERFSSTATYQYYEPLLSVARSNLSTYIREKICTKTHRGCHADAASIVFAAYIDIDYDAISQAFSLSAFFQDPVRSETGQSPSHWDADIGDFEGLVKTEIGILNNEAPTHPEELSMGGFLITVAQGTMPKPTLFSFPSRHHIISAKSDSFYSVGFVTPTGLHPKLRLSFSGPPAPPDSSCALHTDLTIPSSFFPDKYQLSSPNFLASNNLRALRALSGETDLEAPNWAVSRWGSVMLLEIAPPPTSDGGWHADIPLHLRYLSPAHNEQISSTSGHSSVTFPWPVIFWACPAEEGTKMNTNPFDRVNLGYDGLFGPKTVFYHLRSMSNKSLVESVSVPVLDLTASRWVESGTVGVIVLGFAWVCWKLLQNLSIKPGWKESTKPIKEE